MVALILHTYLVDAGGEASFSRLQISNLLILSVKAITLVDRVVPSLRRQLLMYRHITYKI